MDWNRALVAIASVASVVGVVREIARSTRRHRRRDWIIKDLDILKLLPDASEARPRLEAHINREVMQLVDDEEQKRRDPFGIVLAVIFIALAAWTAFLAYQGSHGWLVAAVPLALLGVVGLAQDAVPRKRNEKGRPLA
ncbi:MAG: hypothetical protein ACR2FO_08805 [Actinomycetota bacterium]